jgi:hypothetical protein
LLNNEAQRLLAELREATAGLGDALVGARFPPGAWQSPDASLPTLSGQLSNVRLESLLTRLAEFARDTGPQWLTGDGAALDDFAHEVKVLAAAIRPLRTLAQRQRVTPSSERGRRQLEQALGDVRVGAQLDRLARTLSGLTELAPLLEPQPEHRPAGMHPGGPQGKREHGTGAPEWLLRLGGRQGRAPDGLPAAAKRWRWPGTQLFQRMRPRRPGRAVALTLVAALLVLVVSASALALAHRPPPSGGGKTLTSAQAAATATALHRRSGTPSPERTAAPRTATPAPVPAQLAVSPASITLPCTGTKVTLTVSDTGGQALTWHATVTGAAVLTASSGWVGPHSSGSLSAYSSGGQRTQGTIDFTSNGGTGTVRYRVSCH